MPPNPEDTYELKRFLLAQDGVYGDALAELKNGAKRTHWMWFIFPQVAGLGSSAMAARYAIRSRQEAQAYLDHPFLGARLRECAEALLAVEGKTAKDVMGWPDNLKLRSSMTLFAALSGPDSPFQAVLDRYYSGEPDERTVRFLSSRDAE